MKEVNPMKRLLSSIGIHLFLVLYLYSQEIISDALKYYPLQNENYWEYVDYVQRQFGTYDSTFYSIEITGDSLLPNSKFYKILKRTIFPDRYYFLSFERVDSATANVYRYDDNQSVPNNEYLIDSLLSNKSDTCQAMREYYSEYPLTTCEDIYDGEVLEYSTRIKSFWDRAGIPGLQYKLAKDVGYIGDFQCEVIYWGTDLLYARVNGLEIGSPITSLTSQNKNPFQFKVYNAYPNPFNSSITLSFYSPFNQLLEIKVFDIMGSEIDKIFSGFCNSGLNKVKFSADRLSSGLYIFKLRTIKQVFFNKVILIK